MKPWKSNVLIVSGKGLKVLQWGHGDEAVEEWRRKIKVVVPEGASMGPRR